MNPTEPVILIMPMAISKQLRYFRNATQLNPDMKEAQYWLGRTATIWVNWPTPK